MISASNRFSVSKDDVTKTPLIQKGIRVFTTNAKSEEEYTISIQNIVFDEFSTFSFSVSLFHQAHELFLVEDPVITGMDEEANAINVRLKINNTGEGAFEVKLFYTVFGG
jgi:S-adenosylhomocysteine hydrolase